MECNGLVIRNLIHLAHGMKLGVVAEGVEATEQLDRLQPGLRASPGIPVLCSHRSGIGCPPSEESVPTYLLKEIRVPGKALIHCRFRTFDFRLELDDLR